MQYSRMNQKCAEAFALGYDYQHDLACVQLGMNREKEIIFTPQAQSGILPIKRAFEWEGNGLNLTAFKKGANSEDIFVRFVNTLERNATLTIKKADWMKGIYQSSVIEEKKETIDEENGVFSVVIKPYQIATFGLQPKER
ncbi:MAG: glycosyl hydrolase-related protein [Lachnospiraceae bacterium]